MLGRRRVAGIGSGLSQRRWLGLGIAFIGYSSVEPRGDIGKGQRDQHQGDHNPEHHLVGLTNRWDRTDFARLAGCDRSIDAAVREDQRDQRNHEEPWAERLQTGQLTDPGTTQSDADEDQRTKAACGRQHGGQAADGQGAFLATASRHRRIPLG